MIDRTFLDDLLKIPTEPTQELVKKFGDQLTEEQYDVVQNLVKNHTESFDYFLQGGLKEGIDHVPPFIYQLHNGQKLEVRVIDYSITNPQIDETCFARVKQLYPSECRQRSTSYTGKLNLTFSWALDGIPRGSFREDIGQIPIMTKSLKCNLVNASPREMVRHKEDAEDFGGYFVINGNERIIRMLIAVRRNYPIGLSRNTWKDSFPFYSEFGVSMRCIGPGEKNRNMVLHYLTNGTAKLKTFYNERPFTIPVIMAMRALVDFSDKKIFTLLMAAYNGKERQFFQNSILSMMKLLRAMNITNQHDALNHLGRKFKEVIQDVPSWWTEVEVAEHYIDSSIAIHLPDREDKFFCLVVMTQKLFALAKAECAIENEDNPMFHEVATSGQIYFGLLLERIELLLKGLKVCFERHNMKSSAAKSEVLDEQLLTKLLKMRYATLCNAMVSLVGTGNLASPTGLGLKQKAGLSVMAEKINYLRFLSNFRAVHRGAFFTQMRTTACRKLYPEAWGFMCPVHTPDGTPCGLLNHLSLGCIVTCNKNIVTSLHKKINDFSTLQPSDCVYTDLTSAYPILLDGRLVGYVEYHEAKYVVDKLRKYKVNNKDGVPNDIEICLIPKTSSPTQFPGLFIFTNIFRMMRPVLNMHHNVHEFIGSFEQVYLDISIRDSEIISNRTTHSEISLTSFLSVLGCLIPYPDFNQSPRNMYCCQMTKQTMGSASHTLKYRCDTKMYSIETPQSPLVRPAIYDHFHLDDFALGTNAVVAVISYTGYDMEDAMIINKAAAERGFTTGSVMKTVDIDLMSIANAKTSSQPTYKFGFVGDIEKQTHSNSLDEYGLPLVGTKLAYDTPLCAYYEINDPNKVTKYELYHYTEGGYVYDVKLIGSDKGENLAQRIKVTIWIPRRPFVGDKYANRHGQKGVCSLLWPQESMPFTESGMTPDIIFNPHGYPSRMTIGMMLESMSGKASAMMGEAIDATPFRYSEENTASEDYGKMMENHGFNYYGTEKMYSGVDGSMMTADIFIGLVYYIRLRHMVSDKYQVRSTGPVDQVTHQPVKGRRRGGGVRFGEMERDSLLAHGASFLLQDRLFNCSDKTMAYACAKCGSLVSTSNARPASITIPEDTKDTTNDETGLRKPRRVKPPIQEWTCRLCNSRQNVRQVLIPHVLLYLTAELAQVNISLRLDISNI